MLKSTVHLFGDNIKTNQTLHSQLRLSKGTLKLRRVSLRVAAPSAGQTPTRQVEKGRVFERAQGQKFETLL